MRAAIYCRKSTESAEGIERQAELSRQFCESKGWTVAAEPFIDNGISGAEFDRPGLNALLKAIEAKPKRFDVLVIMESSRLGREQGETLALQGRIVRAGVRIFHYQDGQELRLKNAKDKLVASVGNFGAESFREEIQNKTRATLRLKAQEGKATGAAPFGYRLVPQNVGAGKSGADKHTHCLLEVDEAQAEIVRRIFALSAEGRGDRTIADILNSDGVAAGRKLTPKKGKRAGVTASGWGRNEVARVLQNEIYIGIVVWRDKTDGDVRVTEEQRKALGLPSLRIVTDAQWQAVRGHKAQLKAAYARTAEGKLLSKPESGFGHLLSGILRCHVCGGALGYQKKQKEQAKYRCTRRAKSAAKCSNASGIPAVEVERWIRAAIVKLLANDSQATADIIEARLADSRAKLATHGDPYADAQIEAARLETEIANLVKLAASGNAPASILSAIAEKESRVAVLKATEPTVRPFDRSEYLSGLRTVTAKYAALLRVDGPQETTRAALKRLGITHLTAAPLPGSRLWDISGRIDLEKALTEVHADDAADPFGPDYGPADFGDVPESGVDAAFLHSIVSPLVGCLEERAG